MSHRKLEDAIERAKTFSKDTAIVQSESGDYSIITVSDVTQIPTTFKHVATVRAIVRHEVIYI